MNAFERKQKIESYGAAYQRLVEALGRFPREAWQFRPEPDCWTIHEIVVHIADSEVNSYVRCRRFIAEPGSSVLGYDEKKWTIALNYHAQDPASALELFKWLRQSSYELIRTLPEAAWANTVVHSENGVMTMDDWLTTYEHHIPAHIAQMEENYAEWIRRSG